MTSTFAAVTSNRGLAAVGGMLVCACCLAVTAGCRQSPPPETPPATAPAQPSSPAPDQSAVPQPPASPDAAGPPSSNEPVAIPKPIDAESGAARPAPAQPGSKTGRIELKPVDGEDSVGAPESLPKSGEIGGWVKVEPVRVVAPSALAEIVALQDATRFARFRLTSAALCTYALPRDAGGGRPAQAHVLLVETETPSDAFGLLTCQSTSSQTANVGGETRIDHEEGVHLHGWQGCHYVHVWSEPAALSTVGELLPLHSHIVGKLAGDGAPELVDVLPQETSDTGRRWLVRHLGSLAPHMLPAAALPDTEKVSELLGLNRDTLMCIAAYDVPDAQGPNIVFVVRYPSESAANAAYLDYAAFLVNAVGPSWESTNLLKPRGTFLVGTWTAEEESLQYMMPRVERRLPRQ